MNNLYILTGAIGAGKTSVLNELKRQGVITVPEPAREIIAEQRSIQGEGLYDQNPALFYQLMLSRSIYQHKQYTNTQTPVIFDRGIADNIVYADLFGLDHTAALNAAKLYRYQPTVFFLPAWEEIYVNDEDRQLSFLDAKKFGDALYKAYESLGYTLIKIEPDTPIKRAAQILVHTA